MKKIFAKIGTAEIRNIIAIISVLGAFLMLYMIIIKPIPAENKETVNLCVGFVLGGLIAGVNGYYFGASKRDSDGSKSGDNTSRP
ncbi:MAG TPA: hypothetical protein VGO58_15100 [Chitinophagaceae bacterium]|jgi:hypothetical protein|nr:hypothetical protein [Chitinophagaceae bacterium]